VQNGAVRGYVKPLIREEVATQATSAGPLENPQASTWQVLVNLIQNAFFQAILPGFERELGRGAPPRAERRGAP
jgi:hypothetical protein